VFQYSENRLANTANRKAAINFDKYIQKAIKNVAGQKINFGKGRQKILRVNIYRLLIV
jgi:hypothetical protein